jgi:hypothetical protein
MPDFSKKTSRIALGGILGALAVICLFLAVVLPTNRLAFYALSSFFSSIIIIESGIKSGWVFYAATAMLSAIIIPDKIGIIPYLIFFGIYGIIKFYIERMNRIVVEYILKYVYFNICIAIAILLIKQFFVQSITVAIPWWAVILLLELVFLLYDYVYTLFIAYYRNKLKNKLRIG